MEPDWTPTEDSLLKALKSRGKTWREIGFILNRSHRGASCRWQLLNAKAQEKERPNINAETMWAIALNGRTFGTPKPEAKVRPIVVPRRYDETRSIVGCSAGMCAL